MCSFVTTLGRPYNHQEIGGSGAENIRVESGRPVYISPALKPLDRFYQEIEHPSPGADGPDSYYDLILREKVPLIYHDSPESESVLPAPKMFTQKGEFSQAVNGWYDHCRQYFAGVQMPYSVSSSYWLPEPPKIFSEEEKKSSARFRTFKAGLWPLLPANYMDMLDTILEGRPINPDEEFSEQIPKREIIYHKHHMTQDRQWMSQMVPAEPKPIAYDSYEEYERAYRNWASLARSGIEIPIMDSREFASIAALDAVDKGSRPADAEVEHQTMPSNLGWQWVPETVIAKPQMIEDCLGKLLKEVTNGEIKRSFGNERDTVMVFGVNRNEFLKNLEETGVYPAEEYPPSRAFPTGVHWGTVTKDIECVKSMISSASTFDLSLIERIIEYELSPEQYDELLSMTVNKNKFAVIVSGILMNVNTIRALTKLCERADHYRFRISYLLNSLFRNDRNTKVISVLLEEDNIDLLDSVVRWLNLTSPYSEPLIEKTHSTSVALHKINKVYLLSTFMSIMRNQSGDRFYKDAREPCRRLSVQLGKAFENPQILELIRNAQEGDELYRILVMLTQTHSKEIQKVILGTDFMKWISIGKPRVFLMGSIAHSNCVTHACEMLLLSIAQKQLDAKELIKGLTSYAADLLSMVVKELTVTCEECHYSLTGQLLLPLVETALLSDREEVAPLIVPLATLLCSRKFISNWGDTSFQPLLMRVICHCCEILSRSTAILYRERIHALILLAKDESCCFAMSQVPMFIETLVKHLGDDDVNVMNTTWHLFNNITTYPKVVKEILAGSASKSLTDMIDNENNVEALKRFLLFSISVWEMTETPDVCVLLANLMLNKAGKIACLVKTRVTRFEDYPQVIDAIGNYYRAIQRMKVPGTQQFIDAIFTHFSSTITGLQAPERSSTSRRKSPRYSNP